MTFDEQKEYIKANKKIDMKHFNKVSDVTQMIDFLNKEVEEKSEKNAAREINAITEYYLPLFLKEFRGEVIRGQ